MIEQTTGNDRDMTEKNNKDLFDGMTKKEKRWYMFGAIKAALVLWGAISAGIVLFVLFCVFIWLK